MDEKTYLRCISKHYLCDMKMAERLVKSAELNGTLRELDKIVAEEEKELGQNASKYV